MKSKTSGPVLWVRRLLQIDGWGKDLFRIKHRLADQVWLNEIQDAQLDTHTEEIESLQTEVEQLQDQVEAMTLALELVQQVLAVHNETFDLIHEAMTPPVEAPKRHRRSSTIMEKGVEALDTNESSN